MSSDINHKDRDHESGDGESGTSHFWQAPQEFGGAALSFLGPGILEVLDALPFYVLLVDRNHRILLANRATRDSLGFEPNDIVGKYCPTVIHGLAEGEEYPGCPLHEAVSTQKAVEREHFDEKTGRWLKVAMYPIHAFTVDGEQIYFHMIEDITDQKKD
ncbi:MAG: PAS domain-containing protein [Thermoleophilia bacterium]